LFVINLKYNLCIQFINFLIQYTFILKFIYYNFNLTNVNTYLQTNISYPFLDNPTLHLLCRCFENVNDNCAELYLQKLIFNKVIYITYYFFIIRREQIEVLPYLLRITYL